MAAKVGNNLIGFTSKSFCIRTNMKIRFALVGCGQIGPRHAHQMAKIGDLVAVCDVDKAKADLLAGQYDCIPFYSLEELLDASLPIDVVAICTPNYLHASQSIRCLNMGFHVICEKPMAISSKDGRLMLEASGAAARKLFVVKQNRYNPPVLAIKNMLNRELLGSIHGFQVNCFWNRTTAYYNSEWKGKKKLDGGILFTQFSHFVDLLYWFLGDVKTVKTITGRFLLNEVMELEDTGFSLLNMENGSIGSFNYTITSHDHNMEGSITLFGSKGTVKIGGQYLNTIDYFSVEHEELPVLDSNNLPNDYGYYQGSMSNHDKVYLDVIQALNNKTNAVVEGLEAIKTIEIIEKMYAAEAPAI